jgi:hypothetical protein
MARWEKRINDKKSDGDSMDTKVKKLLTNFEEILVPMQKCKGLDSPF